MKPITSSDDIETMRMALVGYQREQERIQAAIADLRKKLRETLGGGAKELRRHRISAEGRARIADAQKKRWAEIKRKTTAGAAA